MASVPLATKQLVQTERVQLLVVTPWKVFQNSQALEGWEPDQTHLSSADDGLGGEINPVQPDFRI